MLPVAPPPPYAQRARSDDVDEVTSWVAKRDGEHSRVVHETGPYGYEAAILTGKTVKLGWFRTGLRQTVRARFPWSCVHVPINRTQQYAFGRRRIGVVPGGMAFIPTGTETTSQIAAGSTFALQVDDAALADEALARCPSIELAWPQTPVALELPEPLRKRFDDAVAELVRTLGPDASPTERMRSERRVIAALADALPVSSGAVSSTRLAKRRLADLEAWIDAHLGETITIGRLSSVAQAGERSLQLAFQARRGMSPMRFVCERRLAAAHRRIANASAEDETTSIATNLGFTHLGRFSIAYREVFGESPSRTLQRGRSKAAGRVIDPA
jgi:AraC-like DNA-binding protein